LLAGPLAAFVGMVQGQVSGPAAFGRLYREPVVRVNTYWSHTAGIGGSSRSL